MLVVPGQELAIAIHKSLEFFVVKVAVDAHVDVSSEVKDCLYFICFLSSLGGKSPDVCGKGIYSGFCFVKNRKRINFRKMIYSFVFVDKNLSINEL